MDNLGKILSSKEQKRVKEVNYGHNVKIASIGNSHF